MQLNSLKAPSSIPSRPSSVASMGSRYGSVREKTTAPRNKTSANENTSASDIRPSTKKDKTFMDLIRDPYLTEHIGSGEVGRRFMKKPTDQSIDDLYKELCSQTTSQTTPQGKYEKYFFDNLGEYAPNANYVRSVIYSQRKWFPESAEGKLDFLKDREAENKEVAFYQPSPDRIQAARKNMGEMGNIVTDNDIRDSLKAEAHESFNRGGMDAFYDFIQSEIQTVKSKSPSPSGVSTPTYSEVNAELTNNGLTRDIIGEEGVQQFIEGLKDAKQQKRDEMMLTQQIPSKAPSEADEITRPDTPASDASDSHWEKYNEQFSKYKQSKGSGKQVEK